MELEGDDEQSCSRAVIENKYNNITDVIQKENFSGLKLKMSAYFLIEFQ